MPIVHRNSLQWLWYYAEGPFQEEDWDRWLKALKRFGDRCAKPSVVFVMIKKGAQAPTPLQRERIAAVIKNKANDNIIAVALVLEAALARGMVTAVGWIARPSYKQKTFSKVKDDVWDWLRQFASDAIVNQLKKDFLTWQQTELVQLRLREQS